MKKMKRIAAITLSVLMLFAFMPFLPGTAEEAYAEGEMPEITVTIDPGVIGGDPIVYKSTDEGRTNTSGYPSLTSHGMFDWTGDTMWYRYPDLPASFSKPGYVFAGWTSTERELIENPGYSIIVDGEATVTAQWTGCSVTLEPGEGTGDPIEMVPAEDGKFIFPDLPEGYTSPSADKVFSGWKAVWTDGTWIWYDPGDEIRIDMSKINQHLTLVAGWSEPKLSLCAYDDTNLESGKGGLFKLIDENGYYGQEWSPGCNNYTADMGGQYEAIAVPDNGYRFLGWYNGKYIGKDAQGQYIQDAVPYMDQLLTTNRAYDFTVTDNTTLCPVFEEAPLINFVDIGNVWTDLDPVNPPAFTLETNPNEEGPSDFIEIAGEKWEAEDGQAVEMHYEAGEGSEGPVQVVTGAFVKDKTYKYTAYVRAKGDNTFNTEGFRFIYGGTEYAWTDLEVTFLENNKVAAISGFVPDTTVKGLPIEGATVTGIKTKTYTGKAQTQAVAVTVDGRTLEKGTDYTVSYKNNIRAGTATMTITGIGDYEGSITKTFKINKAANPMTVKAKTATVRYSRLRKANQTLTVSKVLTISKKQGTATYVKKSGSSKITISKKTGKVTIKKGLKKGTYRVKVAVTASGTTNYNKVTKTVTFTVKVR